MPKLFDIPECPGIPAVGSSRLETREYTIRLMTPMFGGGVEAGSPDPTMPIRGTSIRGQLRHWWRLTLGLGLGERMWRREEEIFGSTEFPSAFSARVLRSSGIELFDPTDRDVGPIAYALFPAIENQKCLAREGVAFELQLTWCNSDELRLRRKAQNHARSKDRKPLLAETIDSITSDIEGAFRAWIAFGGLGARTGRGCGALQCSNNVRGIPTLSGRIFIGEPKASAIDAWREAVEVYRDFRQTPRGAKHRKTLRSGKTVMVPGRSHWPEADSIRMIAGCSLKLSTGTHPSGVPADENTHDHSTPVVPAELLPAFPKAVLGLPINFHFADGPGKHGAAATDRDPQDVQLYPLVPLGDGRFQKCERMASPVITRPLWFEDKWHPAVIILAQRLPERFQARLEGLRAQMGGANLSHDISQRQIADPSLGRIQPMRGKASALEALVEHVTKAVGFTERQI